MDTEFLEQANFMAILPEKHPLARYEQVPATTLCSEPFLLLEKGGNTEVTDMFRRCGLTPDVRFTFWDDYAIMSMVEHGLGVSILPKLVLTRIPYRIALRPLEQSAFRQIGLAVRRGDPLSPAASRFMAYLAYRNS